MTFLCVLIFQKLQSFHEAKNHHSCIYYLRVCVIGEVATQASEAVARCDAWKLVEEWLQASNHGMQSESG